MPALRQRPGIAPLDELKRDRPAEYEALKKSGELGRRLAGPPSPLLDRASRVFGWTALTVGLALVVGILYAVLFAYR